MHSNGIASRKVAKGDNLKNGGELAGLTARRSSVTTLGTERRAIGKGLLPPR